MHPGSTCEDFRGEINIITYVKRELQFNAGDMFSQLLLFPYIKGKTTHVERIGVLEVLENVCSDKPLLMIRGQN